ncbi:uncharacterized protein JCM6883_003105 [Sporobolomyces salmoneus]|uniref:uncharacterized protein n=1 Tax=Sporobolomyces salmoneus TaxID=183962 RepID=UPI00316D1244
MTLAESDLHLAQAQYDANLKKAGKAKDLSHVPCKFYKANSCNAGSSCPFSHDLVNAGQSKPICQWFAKGNCKFGHKCALAHVLPGQPMSFDRKNKRAAQTALREAQASMVEGTNMVNTTNAIAQSPSSQQRQIMDQHDILQSLKQSVDYSGRIGGGGGGAEAARAFMLGGTNGNGGNGGGSSSGASQQGDFEAVFGSPDSLGSRRTPASSPGFQHRTLPHPHDSPHSPLSFASIAQGDPVNFIAPPSASGIAHHLGSNGRGSVAAHAMLSEQARRLSNTSQSLSPPRPQHFGYSTSVPLAVPGALSNGGNGNGNGNGQQSIFGTSPFSGSRGLFIPSSYDSNEDGFPRSPPSRPPMLGDMQRSYSNSGGWPSSYRSTNEIAIADEDEGEDDGFDEGFLPSSLNDLLTPEEMRRRTLKAQNGHVPSNLAANGGSPSPSHQFLPSKSVPVDLLLSGGKPSLPNGSVTTPSPWGTVNSSSSGQNPSAQPFTPPQSLLAASRASTLDPALATLPPPPPTSFLSASPSHHFVPPAPFYPASFNDALGGQFPSAPRYPQTGLSPNTNAALAAPGSSLPGGLAAGLSRLHLVPPPNYTGETPPMSYSQALGASNRVVPNGSANGGGGGATVSSSLSSSSNENVSPNLQSATLPHLQATRQALPTTTTVASPLHHEVVLGIEKRNASGNDRVPSSGGISSAGSTTGEEDLGGLEDEIQFDMDT